jgi:thiol-disulfide isomerase/thioredoxin
MRFTQILSTFLKTNFFDHTYLANSSILLVLTSFVLFTVVAYYAFRKYQEMMERRAAEDVANNQERSEDVTIMLFSADWCKYCKAAKPIWDAFVSEYHQLVRGTRRIICTKIDCTDPAESAAKTNQFGVNSFPTILMVKDGKIVRFDASVTKEHLDMFVEKML